MGSYRLLNCWICKEIFRLTGSYVAWCNVMHSGFGKKEMQESWKVGLRKQLSTHLFESKFGGKAVTSSAISFNQVFVSHWDIASVSLNSKVVSAKTSYVSVGPKHSFLLGRVSPYQRSFNWHISEIRGFQFATKQLTFLPPFTL